MTEPAHATLSPSGRRDQEAVHGLGALAIAREGLTVTLPAMPAGPVPAPSAARSLRARCAASAAHSARLRIETAATGQDLAWTLDMLAVTLDATAARCPDHADRFAARSASVRALAARIRQHFPSAAVPPDRSPSRPP